MSVQKHLQSTKSYIHMAIILILMLGVGFLPAIDPITPYGMRVLGIFLGCIYGWTVSETIWPSIIGLLLLGLSGENTIAGVLGGAYGNQTLLMVVFSLLFCYCIESSGVLVVIAKWILSRKFAQKGPWMLAFAFFLTASVASILVLNSMPVALLLWTIFYDICDQLDIKPYSKYATIVMVGIVICAYAGGVVMPYNAFALIGLGVLQTVMPEAAINYGTYMLTMLLINVILIPVLTIFFKLICPKIDYKPVHLDASETKLTTRHKLVLLSIVLLCLCMTLPSILPATNIVGVFFKKLGALGAIVLIPTLLMMCTYKRERFLDINDGMMHGVTWNLYYLLATALAMSSAIVGEGTGIAAFLNNLVNPLLAGHSIYVVIAMLLIIGLIMTNCINNIVTISLLMPVAFTYVTQAGGEPMVIAVLFIFVCYQGVAMPAGSVCGALLHGNTKWLKPGMIYKYATLGEIALLAVLILFGIPIANLFIG